jgi:predicted glycosyltransferase
VLGLRDILDAPDVVQSRWQSEGAYAAMEQYYDRVLVYGRREVYDLAEQYRFPPNVMPRMRYCGYVCTPVAGQNTTTRATYLADAGADAKLVVAMAGGGADAYPMMRALVDALRVTQDRQPCVLVLVTGPFMPLECVLDLQERLRGLPAHVLVSVSDSLSLIQSADLVVAMAGYNTTMELLQLGKPAILIPRAGPSAEQRLRARLFATKGWITTVDPDDLHTGQLAQAIVNNLASAPRTSVENRPDLNGLTTAVDQLIALLPPTQSKGEAPGPVTVDRSTQSPIQMWEPVECHA